MIAVYKKETGKHKFNRTINKVEMTEALMSPCIHVLNANGISIKIACREEESLNTVVQPGQGLRKTNLFLAAGSEREGIEIHPLMAKKLYVIVEVANQDLNYITGLMKHITLYLNEPAVWDGDEITLSRDYDVHMDDRYGVILDCSTKF